MPIIKDGIGNVLHEGSLVLWKSAGMVLEIVSIKSGGLAIGNGNQETEGEIVFQFRSSFPPKQPNIDLKDFYALVDPKLQEQMRALAEAKEQSRVS